MNAPYFTSEFANPPLRALRDGEAGGNGVYKYGTSGFPTRTFSRSNYWVDVIFNTEVPPDTMPPIVSERFPASGATGVATGTTVQVTFSEAMNSATITASGFELRTAANTLAPVGVSYNGGTLKATLSPSSPLAQRTTYTAKVKGGAGGVKDVANMPSPPMSLGRLPPSKIDSLSICAESWPNHTTICPFAFYLCEGTTNEGTTNEEDARQLAVPCYSFDHGHLADARCRKRRRCNTL